MMDYQTKIIRAIVIEKVTLPLVLSLSFLFGACQPESTQTPNNEGVESQIEKAGEDAGKAIEEAGKDAGKTIEDAKKATEEGLNDAGNTIKESVNNAGEAIEEAGKSIKDATN
jgi:hypothetical protein